MMKGFRIDRNDGRIYAMGMTAVSGGVHFSFPSRGETCAVILYRKGAKSPRGRIEFPVNARTGDVWKHDCAGRLFRSGVCVRGGRTAGAGPLRKEIYGYAALGKPGASGLGRLRTPVDTEGKAYDWEDDILPCIPYDQCVIYLYSYQGIYQTCLLRFGRGQPGNL